MALTHAACLWQVGAYAQRFRFLALEHEEVTARLAALERLLKQHGATSCAALLQAARKAEGDLDAWFLMEGTPAHIVLFPVILLDDAGQPLSLTSQEFA